MENPFTDLLLEDPDDDMIRAARHLMIEYVETRYDPNETVYLFTFTPHPDESPNASIHIEHQYWYNLLIDFLQTCSIGAACVEVNTSGHIHYHGWYQHSEDCIQSLRHYAFIKVFKKYGSHAWKVTKAISVKPGNWSKDTNGFYYYRKECTGAMLRVFPNPVFACTPKDESDWAYKVFFNKDIKNKTIIDKISDRQYYLQFYSEKDVNAI